MASQHNLRFGSPVFNQNFPPNNFNVNPGMDEKPRHQFHRPPNPAVGSFQSSERFMHGFQNRPQFSNFADAGSFLNRPPPPTPLSTSHPPNPLTSNRFPALPNSSSSPFPPQPHTLSPTPISSHPLPPSLSHPPPPHHSSIPSHPPPSFNQPHFSSQNIFKSPPQLNQFPKAVHPGQQNQFPKPTHPDQQNQFRETTHSGQQNQFQPMSHTQSQGNQFPKTMHPGQQNQFPPMSHTQPEGNQYPKTTHPGQRNQFPPMSQSPLQSNQFSKITQPNQQNQFLPMSFSAPQRNQFTETVHPAQQNQFPPMSHSPVQENQFTKMTHLSQPNQFHPMSRSPNQHQRFHMNSSSPIPRPRFDNSFQRPYRPWTPRFSGPRIPFSNRSPNVVKPNQFRDTSHQQVNKQKKQRNREFKKLKDDSTEKPFACDTCDRAFVTESELKDHISQHIKCDYKNCTFEAHPKIVLLHKKMQHETGYAERISKLKDDAEIKKWREERRKRFPTAENIKKRQAEQAERLARGEVLETKEFGKFKRRREDNRFAANNNGKRMRGYRGRRNRFRRNYSDQHAGFQQFKVNSESDSDSDSHITLNMFSGLSSLANFFEEMPDPNEIVESGSSKQNLPKSILNVDENHLIASHSENISSDQLTKSQVHSNAEKVRESAIFADESVLEIPENEIEKPEKELIAVEDSDDEGPDDIKIIKSQEKVNLDSDDEGPDVVAIIKCQENVNLEKEETRTNDVNATVKIYETTHENNKKDKKISTESNDVLNVSNINHEDTNKEQKTSPEVNDASNVSEINHEDNSEGNQFKKHSMRKRANCNGFSTGQDFTNRIRSCSLLEKLLADDIRHERNVLLQCIRHIVNNNFFGLAVKKS